MIRALAALVQDPEKAGAIAQVHTEERLEFLNMPELWVVGLVIAPLVLGFAWWSYGGLTRISARSRAILSVLRGLARQSHRSRHPGRRR